MGVSGGAVFPPIQGAIADHFSTRTSYYLVVPCFAYIAGWAVYIWNADGRKWGVDNGVVTPENQGELVNAQVGAGVLSYGQGSSRREDDAGSIKEDIYNVEKA
jgi:FHS family L-fucose permease-like MFS transporter